MSAQSYDWFDIRLTRLSGMSHSYPTPEPCTVLELAKRVGTDLGFPAYCLSFIQDGTLLDAHKTLCRGDTDVMDLALFIHLEEYDLETAIADNSFGAATILFQCGHRLDPRSFSDVVSAHNLQMLRALLEVCSDERAQELVNMRMDDGRSPLHVATGSAECVLLLLQHGADKNLVDDNFETPYDYAVFKRDDESAHLLRTELDKSDSEPGTSDTDIES
mmetsp:Transcript_22301/g.47470  ORF Transcript_22301/g.47470 Transcript_22301/m.47470 type:complete len:218 (-) Transcript_22301:155-808(-)